MARRAAIAYDDWLLKDLPDDEPEGPETLPCTNRQCIDGAVLRRCPRYKNLICLDATVEDPDPCDCGWRDSRYWECDTCKGNGVLECTCKETPRRFGQCTFCRELQKQVDDAKLDNALRRAGLD